MSRIIRIPQYKKYNSQEAWHLLAACDDASFNSKTKITYFIKPLTITTRSAPSWLTTLHKLVSRGLRVLISFEMFPSFIFAAIYVVYTTAMISHFLEGWSADQLTYTTTTVTFIRSSLISTTLPSFQRQSQFRKDHASQKMLLSKSSRKFRHAVAYGYSVARHCWTNWRHGGCRWWRRSRVQRTREWQIEGYIMLVATNNPQELKSELWYFRIIGSLIMHLIKEKNNILIRY